MAQDTAIAMLPYGTRLGMRLKDLPLDSLIWPLGRPDRLMQGTVASLTCNDHLIIYPKTAMHFLPRLGTRAQVSVMVVEPSAIHARHLRYLRFTHRRFFRVLTHNDQLLSQIPNGIKHPFGTTWVPEHETLKLEKSADLSLIASKKRDTNGHLLRHEMVAHLQANNPTAAILGRGYAPFENKADGLAPFRYSVVIENIREPNYFTEKIVDAVLCETVPIYWGCPNIAEFFDTSGMILCQTLDELKTAISTISDAEYQQLLPGLRRAKDQAAHWADLEGRAARAVQSCL